MSREKQMMLKSLNFFPDFLMQNSERQYQKDASNKLLKIKSLLWRALNSTNSDTKGQQEMVVYWLLVQNVEHHNMHVNLT